MKRNTPSREFCENSIKRILMTEVLEKGANRQFRCATDFLHYFESLYPPSDALVKQIQRAIKNLDMPKDENGYYIVNKTSSQFEQEKEISNLFSLAHARVLPFENVETVFLQADAHLRSGLIHLLESSVTFEGKFITLVETSNGVLIYTENKNQLLILLNSLTI